MIGPRCSRRTADMEERIAGSERARLEQMEPWLRRKAARAILRTRRKETRAFTLGGLALLLCVLSLFRPGPELESQQVDTSANFHRHLLASSATGVSSLDSGDEPVNCTPRAVRQFPASVFTQQQRLSGAIILYILAAAYMFLALSIVCDDYFVPSCEYLCEVLKLQDDVAGATFMAAGSSAPELATTIIGVFVTKDDIGLGAVVGSAVFNVMFVPGICALFAGMVIYLKWWPLVRDSLFYTISILGLVFVIMDGKVKWWEAVILLSLYVMYIALMFINPRIERWIERSKCWQCCGHKKAEDEERIPVTASEKSINGGTFSEDDSSDNPGEDDETTEFDTLLPSNGILSTQSNGHATNVKENEDSEDESPLSIPDGCAKRIFWLISLPLTITMFLTIPDCRKPAWRKCFVLTFIMSMLWIGAYSYLMVWMITVVGYDFRVPDTIMGLTFIAAGSSVPDAIASLIVCREGLGDMAISNAIGSNVFDILLCLGLPWLLQSTIVSGGEDIKVYSGGLVYCALTLLTTVLFLVVATHVNKWRLTKPYGVVLLIVYVFFNVLAALYELNIFGEVDMPPCDIIY